MVKLCFIAEYEILFAVTIQPGIDSDRPHQYYLGIGFVELTFSSILVFFSCFFESGRNRVTTVSDSILQ
jgi:hypothetical protein